MTARDISFIAEQLERGDIGDQRWAAQKLGRIKDEQSVEPLVCCIGDARRDILVRRDAIESLGRLGYEGAKEPLMRVFSQPDWRLWRPAAHSLGRLGLGGAKLVAHIVPSAPLKKEEWDQVRVCVHNEGQGPALDVQVDLSGPIQTPVWKPSFPRVDARDKSPEEPMGICPLNAGNALPLLVRTSYRDVSFPHGTSEERVVHLQVSSHLVPQMLPGSAPTEDVTKILQSLGNLNSIPAEVLVLLAPTSQKAELIARLGEIGRHATMSVEQILSGKMAVGQNEAIADALKALAYRAVSLQEKLEHERDTVRGDEFRKELKDMVETFLQTQRDLFMRCFDTMGQIARPKHMREGE